MQAISDIRVLDGNERLSARVFETLQGERFLDSRLVATAFDAPYDIRATSASRNFALERRVLSGRLAALGVTDDGNWKIGIDESAVEGSDAERFLFGHELAHIFLLECMHGAIQRGLRSDQDRTELIYGTKHRAAIEHFCDYFARQAENHWG